MRSEFEKIIRTSSQMLIGRENELKMSLVCLMANGHLLLEDVPGLGKTTLIRVLSRAIGLKFSRIQFTNDLLPSDILGGNVFRQDTGKFVFHPGPIFSEVVMADELNRGSSKVQSALLQAMEEREVSIESKTHGLPTPFLVMATQNPLEQVGTNPLPESQLDRFTISLELNFPDRSEEFKILIMKNMQEEMSKVEVCLDASQIIDHQKKCQDMYVSENIINYILDLLEFARSNIAEARYLSPRAGKDVVKCAKGLAYIDEEKFVLPDHVKQVFSHVVAHRICGPKGIRHGKILANEILGKVPVS